MARALDGPFRWAIFGSSRVARKFAFGLRALGNRATVAVVASRKPENARRFAADLGVQKAVERYSDALSTEIDGVYIATPPLLHEEHAKLAIAAGKSVLIEKPFAIDAAAAERIAVAARAAGVFCMEAMWTRFLPLITRIREELDRGAIGEIRGFRGNFVGADRPDASNNLFNAATGGGALMHRGVYPLSLARLFLGPIDKVQAIGRLGETGVDEDSMLIIRHTSGAISNLQASLRVEGDNQVSIYGTEGTIEIEAPIYRPVRAVVSVFHPQNGTQGKSHFEALRETTLGQRLSASIGPSLRRLKKADRIIRLPFEGNGYHYEAVATMDAVRAGRMESAIMPLADSIEIMRAIDCARAQFS
jgi:predicted dehydrogenase